MRGFYTQAIENVIIEAGVADSVTVTGWIPRGGLVSPYAGALAFIYPSTFEGFGMPVLEAMAASIPVACSDIPPLREVGADAVLYFDPLDEAGIAAALERIVADTALRATLAKAGPERARKFTWERAAERTLLALLAAGSKTGA